MTEMTDSDMIELFETIISIKDYDLIVVDMKLLFRKFQLKILSKADGIIFISDGSSAANSKIYSMNNALIEYEKKNGEEYLAKSVLIYNRFSSKLGTVIDNLSIRYIGGIQRISDATERQIINQISQSPVLSTI